LTRCLFVFLLLRRHPRSPLFPYTTLFRSGVRPGPPHGREAPPGPSVCASGPSARRARALPPGSVPDRIRPGRLPAPVGRVIRGRSEEHTSELQSRENLVCRLLLEKKKNTT